jgi:hypothetical protein
MKDINVSELEAHLSKYLRMASGGTVIVVRDRNEPIGPPQVGVASWRERMASQGRLRLGTQDWSQLTITKLDRAVDIQASLRAVREEPHEVR